MTVLLIWLRDTFGVDIYTNGLWLYEMPGLVLPYIYFHVPLMVITFMPAAQALKPQGAESNATLGGTPARYWFYLAFPVLQLRLLW